MIEFTSQALEAFQNFILNPSLFALPLWLSENGALHPQSPIDYPGHEGYTFQQSLNHIDAAIDPKTALYLILRRDDSLVAITYTPYQAKPGTKKLLLDNRLELIRTLGTRYFGSSLICKEIGEITDVRSWNERDGEGASWGETLDKDTERHAGHDVCSSHNTKEESSSPKDFGFKKNRCRLCDRRMKNPIDSSALTSLTQLSNPGSCIQLTLDPTNNQNLLVSLHHPSLAPDSLPSHLPSTHPSFTFYRHPTNKLLYFVFCSLDSATVQQRMTHTLAIPGLVNVIAKDLGVEVDRKIEIHEIGELEGGFDEHSERDERLGRYRSMYLRNEKVGTESVWEGMEAS